MSNITVEQSGRRFYIRGNTYPIKDKLRSSGCKWDPDAKCWYTGKRDLAESLVGAGEQSGGSDAAPSSDRGADRLNDDSKIAGKATYKGKSYLLVWEGETRRGLAAKLAFADGSKVFWANGGEYQVTKRYQARERYGRSEPMTFGRLQRLRENYAEARAQGNEDGIRNGQRYCCEECGDYVTRGQGTCWETGAAH